MHFLLGAAGLLALIAMAFGEAAAVRVAQVVVMVGTLTALWLAFMIVTERL